MSYITKFAEGFMHLFQTGAETFISWMTGIVPVVLMLMVAMNTLIAFLGEERVTKVAKLSAKNPVTRYLVLPFLSAFMLGNQCPLRWHDFYQNTINLAIMLHKRNFVIPVMGFSSY